MAEQVKAFVLQSQHLDVYAEERGVGQIKM